jgi:FMN phosphatase YigB (HAD superfamily)
MNNKFIFDLDDTLILTEYHYTNAKDEAIHYLIKILGKKAPGIEYMLEKMEQFDGKVMKEMPLSPYGLKRFPSSLVETMKFLCNREHVKYTKANIEEMEKIGKIAFECPCTDIIPNARETLDFLLYKKDELVLLTKGDTSHQMKKVFSNGIDRWFDDRITVVQGDKSPEIILSLVGSHDKSRSYGVGNYYRSDIKPAVGAGITGIFIPKGTWRHELVEKGAENAGESGRVIVLDDIIEIKKKYKTLFK